MAKKIKEVENFKSTLILVEGTAKGGEAYEYYALRVHTEYFGDIDIPTYKMTDEARVLLDRMGKLMMKGGV